MAGESYNEHRESNTDVIKIDEVIRNAKLDEDKLYSSILGGKTDAINNFHKIEGNKTVFNLNHVRDYLNDVYQRLSGMKVQKFGEISKEKNFTGTILAIQIVLKALKTNPTNPKEYNVGKIDGEYNEATKKAIEQFQTDCSLTWKDGKPGKETIGRLVKELDNLINNKRLERGGQEALKADITGIIEESIAFNPYSGIYSKEQKEIIINYILNGKLNSGESSMLEVQIKALSNNMMNWKLKYLIEHSKEPLKDNIQKIKDIEKGRRNDVTNLLMEGNTGNNQPNTSNEIKEVSGNYGNSRAVRNNNPGNIKDSGYGNIVGKDKKGFAIFKSPLEGWNALIEKLKDIQTNGTRNYRPDFTLTQFFRKYDPSNTSYASKVAKWLGVSVKTKVKDLDTEKFARSISYHEDGNMFRKLKDMNIIPKSALKS